MYEIKIIAFGDIHGCYQAAEAAVLLAKKENATSIFLGDYVDRGPNSIKTLEILIKAMKDNPDWIFLRGNHDQMLLDLIFGKQIPNKEFDVYGGRTSNEETSKVFQKWSDLSEIRKEEITKFLESTVFFHEINEWIFVHSPLKNSAVKINDKLKSSRLQSKMILQVHDELVFDVVKEEADEMKALILDCMKSAMMLPNGVPVVAEVGMGVNWLEAH